jgi:predicted transposase/invertase (TIGR01784 family)
LQIRNSIADLQKNVKSIIVADFDFVPESEKCHTVFQTLEKDEHFPFNDLEEIHVLSLKKLSKLDNESLGEWLRFIKSESKEEFMEFAEKSPVFEKAVEVLATVSADDYNRMLYEARLKEWRDNKDRMDGALTDGMKKVFSLWRQGYSVDEAEKKLNLP